MRLTGSIILQYLTGSFTVSEVNRPEKSRGLKGALFCHALEDLRGGFASDWIYVMEEQTASELFTTDSDPLRAGLLILTEDEDNEDKKAEAYLEDGQDTAGDSFALRNSFFLQIPFIRLKNTSGQEVMNGVNRIFASLRSWEEQLLDIQYRMRSAREMLEVSMDIFRNPLLILDDTISVVTYVSPEGQEQWQEIFAPGREKMDLLRSMSRDPVFWETKTVRNAYPGPNDFIGIRTICWNIFRGGSARYILMVVEEGQALTDSDADLLEILGMHVKFALFHQEHTGEDRSSRIEPVLLRILQDRSLDYQEGSRLLDNLGWKSDHSYLALVYRLTYLDQEVLPALSICRYMQEQYPYCCSFLFEGDIITFFDLTLSPVSEEEIRTQLKPFIRDSYLKAGFSRTAVGHMDLRRQYLQARSALDVGSRKYPYQWINSFDQIAFPYILEQAVRRLPARMIVHEGLLRLQESDHRHGTEYIKTLDCYLRHHQNAVQTAKELYIHRSTFLYRLEKIKELLESSLEDPDEVLYLMFSLYLMEQKG